MFDAKKMSVAEILYVAGGDICAAGAEYIHHGTNLRAMWDAIRIKESHLEVVLQKLELDCIEPSFPEEVYKDLAKYFEPQKMPLKEIRSLLDNINALRYDHLKKKYQDPSDLDREFESFYKALNKYLNKKAKDRDIKEWL